MKEGRPSATAQRVALQRAAHQLLDHPRVLDDPVALRIIGEEAASMLREDPRQAESSPLSSYMRAFVAARSRFAEDELRVGVQRGVRQYVILGAGLDTFAYRSPHPQGKLRMFEVDHPDTQAWKRARLEEGGVPIPEDLTFVPVDFESRTIAEGLRIAGFNPEECTFFSWLGVTEYLSVEAVMATFRLVASSPQGSGVVFDYMISPELLTPEQRKRFDALSRRTASAGEPWLTCFDPRSLAGDLRGMGFGLVGDNGPEEINNRYFEARTDGLQVGSLSHIMKAEL